MNLEKGELCYTYVNENLNFFKVLYTDQKEIVVQHILPEVGVIKKRFHRSNQVEIQGCYGIKLRNLGYRTLSFNPMTSLATTARRLKLIQQIVNPLSFYSSKEIQHG